MSFRIRRPHSGRALSALICFAMALVLGIAAALSSTSWRVFASEPPGLLAADQLLYLSAIDNYVLFDELRSRTKAADIVAFSRSTASVTASSNWLDVDLVCVTDRFFATMGVTPLAGRFFTSDSATEVVVAERTVRRLYGGDIRMALGQTLQVGSAAYAIVGVVREDLGQAISAKADAWVSLNSAPVLCSGLGYDRRSSTNSSWLVTIARMRAGQQLSELESQIQRVVKEYPKQGQPPINFSVNTVKETFIDARRRERLLLFALNGGGIVLLLVGTWNATGFLLLSALARRRDFQIRVALGASRSQLIAAVLREPTTVFVAATVLAWPVAAVVSLGLSDFLPTAGGQRQLSLAMFVILWGLVCFGVAAAVCTTAVRRQIKTVAIAGGWSTTRRTRLETVLLLSAIAVPCAALIAGVSFGRTLQNLISGLGYDPDSLLVVSVDSQRSKFALDDDVQAYRSQLAAELTSRFPNSPVALASLGPLDYSGPRQFIMVRSRPSERPQLTSISFVSDSYFQVVGSNLVSGRAPQAGGPEMEAVIDLDSQRALFGENNALGACVYLMSSQRCVRVVGVSPVRRARMLKQSTSELFVPVADASSYGLGTIGRTLLVRVNAGDRHAIASHVQGDREVPVQIVEAAELVSAQSGPWRIGLRSLSTLGLVALLLSVIGVAASVALEVRSKVSEIWIRLVLGARQSGVVWLLLRRVLIANTVGIVSGVGVALLLIELVQSRVVNVADAAIAPVVFVSATVAIATLIGALVPAVGAARMKVNSAIGRQN